jgi:hypothetical protein
MTVPGITFDTEECARCDGATCKECGGTGRILSRLGERAREAFYDAIDARCLREVAALQSGDVIWHYRDGVPDWVPVRSVRDQGAQQRRLEILGRIYFVPRTEKVRVWDAEAQRSIREDIARRFKGATLDGAEWKPVYHQVRTTEVVGWIRRGEFRPNTQEGKENA